MTTSRFAKLFAGAALAFAGCNSSGAATRSVDGQLTAGAFQLDNAVVIARAATGKAFVAPVSAAGGFHMLLPTHDSYKLTLANSSRAGVYTTVARISWPLASASAWARVTAGAPIVLANIAPATATASSLMPLSDGSGSGGGGGGSGGSDDGATHESGDDDKSGDVDEIRSCHATNGESDLPYDIRPALGSTFKLSDAFLEKGPAPAAIVSVTGATWHAAELSSDAPITVTQADCDHVGNRAVGRDRVVVTWQNADGTKKSDHLDIRYCDGGGSDVAGSSTMSDDHGCEDDGAVECGDDASAPKAKCDGGKLDGVDRDDKAETTEAEHGGSDDGSSAMCGGTTGGGTTGTTGGAPGGSPCAVNADCATGLLCSDSLCTPPIL